MADNLALSTIAANQNQKETTSNLADQEISEALTEVLSVSMAGGNVTLTTLQMQRYMCFSVTGQTAIRDLTLPAAPAVKRGIFVVQNTSGTYPVVVKKGSTSVTVAAGDTAIFKADGTANDLIKLAETRGAAGTTPYDIGFSIAGKPGASAICGRYIAVRSVYLPINLTGSQSKAQTASTGTVAFDILVNGVSKGSVTYTASATGTFTFSAAVTLAAGDVLSIIGPAVQDLTLSDVSITLMATR